MSASGSRALVVVVGVALAAALAFAFVEGRQEQAREREREQPVKVPPRVTRSASGEPIVEIDRATQDRVGLATEALAARSEASLATAYGAALDPGPLVALHAELTAAEAALAASRAEYERTRTLHSEGENASARALDAAAAQLGADESRVRLAERQIVAGWGEEIASLPTAERETLARRLATRELVMVRASLPLGEALPGEPVGAKVVVLGAEGRPLVAKSVREAPSIEPSAQGRTFLVRVERDGSSLWPGAVATVLLELPGESSPGVVVRRASVVRAAGVAWVYVQLADDHFARRPLAVDHPTADGWFEHSGLEAGERVVVAGAQTLLSEEQKSQIEVGEQGEGER